MLDSELERISRFIKNCLKDTDAYRALVYPSKNISMNSDQMSFDLGVGVCACKYKPRIGYYCDKIHTKADTEAEVDPVTIGATRTAADLTAGQKAYLAAKGYKVIAVLPEISANADGQQEFAVTLDEDAPEGAKMVYVPFPQDVEETEDDKIADFYGADGEAIEEVPAEKEITVAPWLRADVVYQPVIAVED